MPRCSTMLSICLAWLGATTPLAQRWHDARHHALFSPGGADADAFVSADGFDSAARQRARRARHFVSRQRRESRGRLPRRACRHFT